MVLVGVGKGRATEGMSSAGVTRYAVFCVAVCVVLFCGGIVLTCYSIGGDGVILRHGAVVLGKALWW